jgi:hypothetical protein
MAIPGVEKLLYFKQGPNGVMTPAEFESDPLYGFEPDGVNFYYGIDDFNVAALQQTGNALNFDQAAFFQNMQQFALGSAAPEKLVVLGLEPPHLVNFQGKPESGAGDPFGFLLNHLDLVTKLADELNAVQQSVRSDSNGAKQLGIVVRYASEMNDRPHSESPTSQNCWGHQPAAFKQSFQTVRNIFSAHAPGLLFTFSPAIRADLDPAVNPHDAALFELSNYWPGDNLVNSVSCTWYVDGENTLDAAFNYFKSYFLQFQPRGKPLGVDEIGGVSNGSNQAVLTAMIAKLGELAPHYMHFNYLTFFLSGQYGIDANLTGFA